MTAANPLVESEAAKQAAQPLAGIDVPKSLASVSGGYFQSPARDC